MLAETIERTQASRWLINTGWVGGMFGTGSRCSLKYTRTIINAYHSGQLAHLNVTSYATYDIFRSQIPTKVVGAMYEVLDPSKTWENEAWFQSPS